MANISDIAGRANVSPALVSRVLNNKPGVSPANRKKILEIIKELNYTPNALARSLVTQKTQTIGVVMDELCEKYFFNLINGLQDMGAELDYNIIFCSGRNRADVKFKYVDYFSHGRADGIIAFGSRIADGPVFRDILDKISHFVLIEGSIPDYEYNSIQVDNVEGAYRATKHLIAEGYKNIWHVTGDLTYNVALDRMDGFLKAMRQSGALITPDTLLYADFEEELACVRMGERIREGKVPDACFVGSDKAAYGVIRALRSSGLRVPEDVAIIGFDDDAPDSIDMVFPKLTTMRQPLYEMGRAGVKLLVESLLAPKKKPEKIVFQAELIIRETCK